MLGGKTNTSKEGSEYDDWRVIVEDGGPWREGVRVMLMNDNTNNCLRICVQNKNLRVRHCVACDVVVVCVCLQLLSRVILFYIIFI
jgi:hypothetical protein